MGIHLIKLVIFQVITIQGNHKKIKLVLKIQKLIGCPINSHQKS